MKRKEYIYGQKGERLERWKAFQGEALAGFYPHILLNAKQIRRQSIFMLGGTQPTPTALKCVLECLPLW